MNTLRFPVRFGYIHRKFVRFPQVELQAPFPIYFFFGVFYFNNDNSIILYKGPSRNVASRRGVPASGIEAVRASAFVVQMSMRPQAPLFP